MSPPPTMFISAAAHQRTLALMMAENRTESAPVIDAPPIVEREPPAAGADPLPAPTVRFATTKP
eukprot:scaffold1655_cov47-Attheya_sp.AAC.1